MSVDLTQVDLAALIEREANIRFGKAAGRDKTRKGACPFCGGTDRFAVFCNDNPQRFKCGIHGNGCGAAGDAIDFLRGYKAMSFHAACDYLGIQPDSSYTRPRSHRTEKVDTPPSRQWQDKALSFCNAAKIELWGHRGVSALDYLHKRGLTDETIDQAGLGLSIERGYQPGQEWGMSEDVWIARGIVIPWVISGDLWAINIRRSDKDLEAARARGINDPHKYHMVAGSSEGLYGSDTIQYAQPLALVESELDRLSLLQGTNGRIACVATGGTGKAQGAMWVSAVKLASTVLLLFDYDENGSGQKCAKEWSKLIPGATRYTPWKHDINDMLTSGIDLNMWLDGGLALASLTFDEIEEIVTPPPQETTLQSEIYTGMTREDIEAAIIAKYYQPALPEKRVHQAPKSADLLDIIDFLEQNGLTVKKIRATWG